MHDEHLNCDDDLSSFQGEIFLLDRTMLQNPIRLLSIPTNTHMYGKFCLHLCCSTFGIDCVVCKVDEDDDVQVFLPLMLLKVDL